MADPHPEWQVHELGKLVDSRVGSRANDSRIWHWEGEIISLGNGRTLAGIEGVETVRLLSPLQQRTPQQQTSTSSPSNTLNAEGDRFGLSGGGIGRMDERDGLEWSAKAVGRKVFYYKDVENGRFMNEWRLRPTSTKRMVYPIVYPFQVLTFGLKKGRAVIWSETSVGLKVRAVAMRLLESPRRIGRAMTVSFAYLSNKGLQKASNRRIVEVGKAKVGGGKGKGAGIMEKFDLVLDGDKSMMFWVRHGRCPSWYGGNCVTYLRGTVRKSWNDLPERLVQHVKSTQPGFNSAPRNIEEIQGYQAGHRKMLLQTSRKRKRLFGFF